MSNELYRQQRQQMLYHPLFSWPGLGAWSFYFLVKVALVTQGFIELDLLWNIALFTFLVIPAGPAWLRFSRQCIAAIAATVLFYAESSLPPFERLIAQWDLISAFSTRYLFELITRLVSIEWIAALLISWILYMYLNKLLRMTTVTLAALLSVPFWSGAGSNTTPSLLTETTNPQHITGITPELTALEPNQILEQFYREQREVVLTPTPDLAPDFDILILNICSLSWSDLKAFDLLDHPFMSRADILLTNFYSGSSYSGPAALRLLQASCGQRPHSELFAPIESCTLGSQLRSEERRVGKECRSRWL